MSAVAICVQILPNSAAAACTNMLLVIAESHVEIHLHFRSPTLTFTHDR
jgi:hypothetical protein